MRLLLLEGLTGAGKSSTLASLQRRLRSAGAACAIFYEEATFGELMDELAAGVSGPQLCWRLETVLAMLPPPGVDWVILERFHPSYYALHPQWELYAGIDARLAQLGARLVLLDYPDDRLAERALYRHERSGWSDGWLQRAGSETAALAELGASLQARREAAARSRLPVLRLDTSARDWEQAAAAIQAWV